jgi:hypothetical protein
MDSSKVNGIRVDSRAYAVIFKLLALVTFAGTLYVAFKVSDFGSQLGVTASNNPATWIVLVVGIFSSLMLASVGLILNMLCAIFDRLDFPALLPPANLTSFNSNVPLIPADGSSANLIGSAMAPQSPETTPGYNPRATKSPKREAPDLSSNQKTSLTDYEKPKSKLWMQLTKERHFFND